MTARRFELHRFRANPDPSGTGVIAEGIEFTDGTVALRWIGEWVCTILHSNIAEVKRIHGYDGSTKVVWFESRD